MFQVEVHLPKSVPHGSVTHSNDSFTRSALGNSVSKNISVLIAVRVRLSFEQAEMSWTENRIRM